MLKQLPKYQIATLIAIFFHVIGIVGILFWDKEFFIAATSFNLLLSFGLLIYTQKEKNKFFLFFMSIVLLFGIGVEIIGVNTGVLFGKYSYGSVLGIKWQNVPLIIGLNWFMIIYCCGISIHTLLMKIIEKLAIDSKEPPKSLRALSVITDGATLAVFFDWLMEPVAVKLGFWTWGGDGNIPIYNYLCWFVISLLLLVLFHFSRFDKQNKFAINLLLIQAMFFLVLRTFLK